ncbi:MAG: DUF2911 domain-containing protein [Flavobacteriaceae bacterium]
MKYIIYLAFLMCLTFAKAQIEHPRISPLAVVEQQIGLTNIKVVYSRPGVRGRTIMGDLVPYGRIWRVGANESTKFTTDAPLTIKGNLLLPGTYALYAFPKKDSWEIAFHRNTTHWGDGRDAYNPQEDVFRIHVVPQLLPALQENFMISFDGINHNSMDMNMAWELTKITIPLEVDTNSLMLEEIKRQIQTNPSAQTYYEAGRYLQEQDQDLPQALNYLNKALEIGGDTYYFHRLKSLVEAALGNYDQAIKSAGISLELANELGKDEFVRMNQKNIELWQNLLAKE